MSQRRDLKRITAGNLMTEQVLTVGEEASIKQLAVLFRIDLSHVFPS